MLWVNKKYNGIIKRLVSNENYVCPRCKGESWPIDGRTVTEVDVDSTMLDVEDTFCYLGDMLCSSGDCDSAIAARCCVAWGKFRKLLPVLTTRHLSPRICGKVYEACVHSAMLHGSKMWVQNNPKLRWLCRNYSIMIHWICVVWKTKTKYLQLYYYRNLTSRISHRCFDVSDSWYGHVQRAMSCIKSITNFSIPGTRKKGRPWNTWLNVWRLMSVGVA